MATIQAILLLFVFLQSLLPIGFTQDAPKITSITPTQIKNVGDTVELSCEVENAKDYSKVWIKIDPKSKDKSFLISTQGNLITPEDRYSVNYDEAKSAYNLKISNVKEIDAGIYQCQILMSAKERISAEVELQVKESITN